jgi:hypothetical protein
MATVFIENSLCGRTALSRRARCLAYPLDMSALLRAALRALHPARVVFLRTVSAFQEMHLSRYGASESEKKP